MDSFMWEYVKSLEIRRSGNNLSGYASSCLGTNRMPLGCLRAANRVHIETCQKTLKVCPDSKKN
jgi:hypothetical protein